jgi:protein-tyrosine phosphatase
LPRLLEQGITVVVDLALDEPPAVLSREMVYCRFPLVDGTGNPIWLLRSAVMTVANLLRESVPTLVSCSAGISRAPAVAAAALAIATDRPLEECLEKVMLSRGGDVSPGFWRSVKEAIG